MTTVSNLLIANLGLLALTDSSLRDDLNISEDQAIVIRDTAEKLQQLVVDYENAELETLNKRAIEEVLSNDQLVEFENLVGESYGAKKFNPRRGN